MDLQQILKAVTPAVYERLKRAVELGRWPDGNRLTPAQRDLCLQAVIAYDFAHLPATERVGYIHTRAHVHCEPAAEDEREQPVSWRH